MHLNSNINWQFSTSHGIMIATNIQESWNDRAERHDLNSRLLLFILLFFIPLFLGSKKKWEYM